MKETKFSLAHWRRNFYLFLSGQFLSGITSMIVQYSIIWYLTELTGSATVLSFATILGMLPMVILSPFVGPLIDRWNKKNIVDSNGWNCGNYRLGFILSGNIFSRVSIVVSIYFSIGAFNRANVPNANHSIYFTNHGS
jgi:MFS family permease